MKWNAAFRAALMSLGLLVLLLPMAMRADVVPLSRAQSRQDYAQKRPLLDALAQGFCGIDADVCLVDGKLLVARTAKSADVRRTLQFLYLDPLRKRVAQNNGRIYASGPELTLMLNLKTDPEPTYAALRDVLKEYADTLSAFRDGTKEPKAVTVILAGNCPRTVLAAEKLRYAAVAGELKDLDANSPVALMPWISEDWNASFKWRGKGTIPDDDGKKLKSIVDRVHDQGRRVRFYNSPDRPDFWKELLEQGVDLINTDDLRGFRQFYLGQ